MTFWTTRHTKPALLEAPEHALLALGAHIQEG